MSGAVCCAVGAEPRLERPPGCRRRGSPRPAPACRPAASRSASGGCPRPPSARPRRRASDPSRASSRSSASACFTVRGKPSSTKPLLRVRLVDPVGDDADHHVVGDQIAARHDVLRLQSDRRPRLDRRPQHVAGRELHDAVLLRRAAATACLCLRRAVRAGSASSPPASELRLLDQPLVLVREEMPLHLLHRIHGDVDDDQQRRAAEIERECRRA